MTVLTIGHSNRAADEFVRLLQAHRVTAVADVRAKPFSRRNPHFSKKTLQSLLAAAGISYEHFPSLGGHRTPREDSVNRGWRNEAFRGYADHMRTQEFMHGIEALLEFGEKYLVAVMCAESQWRDCHRQLLADALVVRAVEVRHIMSEDALVAHQLTPFARVAGRGTDHGTAGETDRGTARRTDTIVEYPALF
jgi:uncharacterized protein (DUF488 family)